MRVKLVAFVMLLFSVLFISGHNVCADEQPAHTIMIYMVGSDLETDRGLASDDLFEIASSGLNDEEIRVLACVGGAEEWKNGIPADQTVYLMLKNGQWVTVHTEELRNMGESGTLSDFLNYSYNHYPADQYGLILWDHGSGPMEGYGRDLIHDCDSLTLSEMGDALAASPFGEDTRLEWIGFDACLMASIETACIFSDYANYMIASQEVEPNDGWSYAFLKQVSAGSTGEMIGHAIIDAYMECYEKEFIDFPQYAPSLTMSLTDIKKVTAAMKALDNWSKTLLDEVKAGQYSNVVRNRLGARGIGRFTTGSEYDLVDLVDLLDQFDSRSTDEGNNLRTAINDAIVYNRTNVDNTNGLSIFFPYYNKQYFTSRWKDEYEQFSFSGGYVDFLMAYSSRWMSDVPEDSEWAALAIPEYDDSTGITTLKLTPEQVENFAYARYVILKHVEGEQFQFIYVGNDVELGQDGVLSLSYNHKAMFGVDAATGRVEGTVYFEAQERNDNMISYVVPAQLQYFGPGGILDLDSEYKSVSFHIAYDTLTNETKMVGITPYTDENELQSGKQQINQYDADMVRIFSSSYYKTYDKSGRLKWLSDWEATGIIQGYEYYTKSNGESGVSFAMLDVIESSSDLYCIIAIKDTYGQRYVAELVPLHIAREYTVPVENNEIYTQTIDEYEIDIDNFVPVSIIGSRGIEMTVEGVNPKVDYNARLHVRVKNGSDEVIDVSINETAVNGFSEYLSFSEVEEGIEASFTYMIAPGMSQDYYIKVPISDLAEYRQTHLTSVEFTPQITFPMSDDEPIETKPVNLLMDWDLTESVGEFSPEIGGFIVPCVLVNENDIKLDLLSAKMDTDGDITLRMLLENHSGYSVSVHPADVSIDGFTLNDSYLSGRSSELRTGRRQYVTMRLEREYLDLCEINMPECLTLRIQFMIDGRSRLLLETDAIEINFLPMIGSIEDELSFTLIDNDDLKVVFKIPLLALLPGTAYDKAYFYIENNMPYDIEISVKDASINGLPLSLYASGTKTPRGMKSIPYAYLYKDERLNAGILAVDEIRMRLLVTDYNYKKILYSTDELRLDIAGELKSFDLD